MVNNRAITVYTTAEQFEVLTEIAKKNDMEIGDLVRECANSGYRFLKSRGKLK